MIVKDKYRLPDFLLVGAQKSGTTSIANYLRQHPDISISRIKEPNFFSYYNEKTCIIEKLKKFNKFANHSFDIITDINDYLKLFDNKKLILGDCSTHYLYHYNSTIKNIKREYQDKYSDLKIIIILRDPVYRAFSAWSMFVRDGKETESFLKAIALSQRRIEKGDIVDFDYLGFSLYANQVEAYLSSFENVKIFIFEDFFKDIKKYIYELYDFIGIDNNFTPDTDAADNISGKPKSRIIYNFLSRPNVIKFPIKMALPIVLRKKIKRRLIKKTLKKIALTENEYNTAIGYFKSDIVRLENIIGRKIESWAKE